MKQAEKAEHLKEAAQGIREYIAAGVKESWVPTYTRNGKTVKHHTKTYELTSKHVLRLFEEVANLENHAKQLTQQPAHQ